MAESIYRVKREAELCVSMLGSALRILTRANSIIENDDLREIEAAIKAQSDRLEELIRG